MDTALWTMFCIMFFTTLAVPGPNVAFSVAQSLHYGSRKASAAAIGFALGTGLHAVIVLSGVGLLAQKYEIILHIIKWGGITLILYQALKAFSVKPTELVTKRVTAATTKELILGAIAVSCTNPKGIIASLLIYPAFVSPKLPYLPQAILLGITAMTISLLVYGSYIQIAGQAKRLFDNQVAISRIVGVVYVCVAIALAISI
ncbi:hypothetical protein BMW22_39330 (plasmid) [Rhizobium leguminosarum]|uniref:LysE family translocator n=2 Tax=Rhizobium TaxID=379 RepID=A0A179C2A5_RHILE|nr:LysE family translocator [Rhizobium leguminosarum]API57429.1 hypothetical protein BMW22_39330 [Rhizobium leguminosarum]OAP97636.1 hypothetical protein A4U53_36385 [Rhizobium leguminosarum]